MALPPGARDRVHYPLDSGHGIPVIQPGAAVARKCRATGDSDHIREPAIRITNWRRAARLVASAGFGPGPVSPAPNGTITQYNARLAHRGVAALVHTATAVHHDGPAVEPTRE